MSKNIKDINILNKITYLQSEIKKYIYKYKHFLKKDKIHICFLSKINKKVNFQLTQAIIFLQKNIRKYLNNKKQNYDIYKIKEKDKVVFSNNRFKLTNDVSDEKINLKNRNNNNNISEFNIKDEENKTYDIIIENNKNKDKNAHPIKLPIYCSIHDNKKFQTIKDYINHYKTTHNNNEYICFICKQKFISIRLLKRHFYKFISINDKDSYNNNYNNQSYNNKDYNNKVINFIANEIDKNEEKKLNYFYCEICNKYFNSKYSKEQHWENKGHDQLVYFCEICNKSFNSLKIKEQYCKHKNCNKVFLCKICNKMFKSKNAMETHCKMKNHYE